MVNFKILFYYRYMKERLDFLLRIIAVGYTILFVITLFVLSFTVEIDLFHLIDTYFYFDSFLNEGLYGGMDFIGLRETPYKVLITILILFSVRWLVFGKTYQK